MQITQFAHTVQPLWVPFTHAAALIIPCPRHAVIDPVEWFFLMRVLRWTPSTNADGFFAVFAPQVLRWFPFFIMLCPGTSETIPYVWFLSRAGKQAYELSLRTFRAQTYVTEYLLYTSPEYPEYLVTAPDAMLWMSLLTLPANTDRVVVPRLLAPFELPRHSNDTRSADYVAISSVSHIMPFMTELSAESPSPRAPESPVHYTYDVLSWVTATPELKPPAKEALAVNLSMTAPESSMSAQQRLPPPDFFSGCMKLAPSSRHLADDDKSADKQKPTVVTHTWRVIVTNKFRARFLDVAQRIRATLSAVVALVAPRTNRSPATYYRRLPVFVHTRDSYWVSWIPGASIISIASTDPRVDLEVAKNTYLESTASAVMDRARIVFRKREFPNGVSAEQLAERSSEHAVREHMRGGWPSVDLIESVTVDKLVSMIRARMYADIHIASNRAALFQADRPFAFMISGEAGNGKTTIANAVARRVGINEMVFVNGSELTNADRFHMVRLELMKSAAIVAPTTMLVFDEFEPPLDSDPLYASWIDLIDNAPVTVIVFIRRVGFELGSNSVLFREGRILHVVATPPTKADVQRIAGYVFPQDVAQLERALSTVDALAPHVTFATIIATLRDTASIEEFFTTGLARLVSHKSEEWSVVKTTD